MKSIGQETSEAVAAAARKAYDKGVAELLAGNHNGAITLLKTAVRIQPDDAAYHHKLAQALMKAEKFGESWVHLRKAATLNPASPEIANDFLKLWRFHDLQGTFNVGTTDMQVLKALGEPDKRIENDTMKRWAYGFMVMDFGANSEGKGKAIFRVIDLRGYTAEVASETQQVKVVTDSSRWKVAHHHINRSNDNLELTLKGERIQEWTELFSKQRFPMMARTNATVTGMLDSLKKSLQQTDPNVEFNVLSQTPTEVVYHWITGGSDTNPAQHEVAKIMKGDKDFFRVAYVKKTNRLTDAELDKWTGVIANATLVKKPGLEPTTNSTANVTKPNNKNSATSQTSTQLQAWRLGRNLSLAALVRGRHGPEDSVKPFLLRASENAQALGVRIPPPKKLTDDAAADTAAAIQFLLDTAGKPIYRALEKKYDSQHAALFEIGTKSNLLMLLYQPGDSTSQAIVAAIERAAGKANLPENIWNPLTEAVKKNVDQKEMGEQIKAFQDHVSQVVAQKTFSSE